MKKNVRRLLILCSLLATQAYCEAASYPGSRGAEVYAIQKELINRSYPCGNADGIYGKKTCAAVKQFQTDSGLISDGIAGQKTLSKLGIANSDSLMLLARVINGEARGEKYEGQLAVGAVVLNRVKHPSFPDSIEDVIYQKGAFSAVSDGQINKKISQSCINAAKEALSGADPTGGAVFYYNPDTATDKWIKTRKVIKRIGNHLFCK